MSFTITYDSKIYDEEGILNHTFPEELEFCKQWLEGQKTFTVTTSGSTGTPKPIEIHRSQMEASAQQTKQALNLEGGNTALICLSTNHIAGKMMLVRTMEMGLHATMVEACSNPFEEYQLNQSFDFVALVPLQIRSILESKHLIQLDKCKSIIVGGGPVSREIEQAIQSIKAPVFHTYGMTETVSHIALKRLNGKDKSDYYTILSTTQIKTDERACLMINSPVTNNEWVTTNDIVEITASNQFKWLGRADNIINSGGVKIQPEKVEACVGDFLQTQSYTFEYFVTALPHPNLGQELVLIIDKDHAPTVELQKYLSLHLSKYEVPRKIITSQQFIYTPTGKINRAATLNALK